VIAGSRRGCLSAVSVLCCHVEVSAMGRSLVQRSPTECGASKTAITQGYYTGYSPTNSDAS
jgi:hypothetical protein